MERSPGRLAEALAGLSLAADLGMGLHPEHCLRTTWLAGHLARHLGLDEAARANVFYVALLHGIGCVADSADLARDLATDEQRFRAEGAVTDPDDLRANLGLLVRHAGSAGPALLRPIALARALAAGEAGMVEGLRAHCEVGDALARRMGVADDVRAGLLAVFERWNGKGIGGLRGEAIPLAARILHIAKAADLEYRRGGATAALVAVGRQSGSSFDPDLVAAWVGAVRSDPPWATLDDAGLWGAVIDLEPVARRLPLGEPEIDAVAEAFADFADLKAPWLVGHSRAVADLAAGAAGRVGLPADERTAIRRSALLHDLGRVAIPSSVHDKPRALTPAEWEVVRLHPYHTERLLARARPLAPLATLAGSHHERLDGSGYHRAAPATQLSVPARLLAAADAYETATRHRPYRAARTPEAAAALLRDEVRRGRLDEACVEAVVDEARDAPRRRRRVEGRLSEREAEVLERIAVGASTREAAADLGITDKTVRHHLEHAYDKLGVSTRAAAVVVALELGLIDPR